MFQLNDLVVSSTEITNSQKANIAIKLGETDRCLQDGADEFLQLLDVAASVMHSLCVATAQ